jgi:adenosine deaminase
MSHAIPEEFIRRIPKTDLHLHLDGSLGIPTLIELAIKHRVPCRNSCAPIGASFVLWTPTR